MSRVMVAMSGGVDSSVAALLLQNQGFSVMGCTMQLWDYRRNPSRHGVPLFGRCCSLDDVEDARRVAERLGVPFYVLNLEEEFRRRVVEPFIGGYLAATTPIPCTRCNTFLKFDRLLLFARGVGIEWVATGHYARVRRESDGWMLLKGQDPRKDQSYYLFELTQEQLAHTLFPLGEYEKSDVRSLARDRGLVTAEKRESQEICFVPDGDYAAFIERHAASVGLERELERQGPGPVFFKDGTRLGTHPGLYRFTVGQRRGLGLSHARPLYVLRLEPARNALVVGYREDLYSRGLLAHRLSWIAGEAPGTLFQARVKIRATAREVPVHVQIEKDETGNRRARVEFESPQISVTPGQAAVFYDGAQVLGGGWIRERIA